VQIFHNELGKGPAVFFAVCEFLIMNFVGQPHNHYLVGICL
jgi:hypothetical protein